MSGASASAAQAETSIDSGVGQRRIRLRVALLAFGAVSLLTGLYGGLLRLGWALPHGTGLADLHGPLMICGLFGTLISLERAVAIGRDWTYAAPAFSALGSFALLAGMPSIVAMSSYIIAAAVLASASYLVVLRHPALYTGTMLFGALAWLAGDILWMTGAALPDVAGWWLTFLILTIAGERLELSRMLQPKPGSEALFLFAIGLLAAGAWNGLLNANGSTLFSIGLLACAAWLLRYDIARRTIRQQGQTRFFAACMLLGYAWLGIAGGLLIAVPPADYAFGYDLALHAVLIGFVLSMVFGHALIILPAVTGLRVQYHARLYAPLAILHIALLLRLAGGLAEIDVLRLWSGPLTIVALLAFLGSVVSGTKFALRYTPSGLTSGVGALPHR
ncbi:MAG: hypothetical protein RO009_06750 [Pseudorhodoplanes sp.]|jgi:hypothetical protein|nr:hypothetical protein [Pseudorhodoplanes sp.]